ncbi:rhamnan synthesis F family protein [Caballeronia sordidicola]|uniref:Alpha-L-Rha alpha-1,2-L-rhamnosyltransferase/alpha-L-Rha alpha-1,3-L-rhamnosyltransferase n=1 Tax=Caballeronia sordidicola TaxID=196367 RepID=A0A226X3A2_CABSO|nr:rhamnan synthesis F family protein [Caballeronia sordidicola]OXC77914.1 Alpha-L-Rha alpha-1,2-L-rhamnosyltransferase/alpha-L-Rha alpha-1,3-L- rhamnosyltransferase [Caballeronia sordidicola]
MNSSLTIQKNITSPKEMKRIAFYMFYDEQSVVDDFILHKLRALRKFVDTIFVVSNSKLDAIGREALESVADTVYVRENVGFDVWAYKEAMEAYGIERLEAFDELILMNYTFFAPIFPFSEMFDRFASEDVDFWGVSAHKEMRPNPFTGRGILPLHIQSHWITVRKRMFASIEFKKYWQDMPEIKSYQDSILQHESKFTSHFEGKGFRSAVYLDPEDYPTQYATFQSIEQTIENRSPIFKRRLFFHDPLFLEQNAVLLKNAIRLVEQNSDYDTELIWKNVARTTPPRILYSNLDHLHILNDVEEVDRQPAPAVRIAVISHLYYPELLDELLEHVVNIPRQFDLFITTSSVEKRAKIDAQLRLAKPDFKWELRVTKENRGRDMSSLFITCRDVVLEGGYDYICRLHSKKSPQNSVNMGRLFKQHLLENLLYNKPYVENLLRIFDENPRVGMLMPPIVHIAYPTLGHAWFANRPGLQHWAKELEIKTPLDEHTPLAPYGTMFWFRPIALEKLFKHEWKWTDFNPEPNHTDGGLAHVLERLIGYAVQDAGYLMHCVMNRDMAASSYVKLEYKLQRIAAALPNGNILDQLNWINLHAHHTGLRSFFEISMRIARSKFIMKHPRLALALRPVFRIGKTTYRTIIRR